VVLDDLFENLVYLGALALDDLLRPLDSFRNSRLNQFVDDEGFEQLDRHRLRKSTLVEFQLRPDDDYRTTGIVDSLSKEILTESTLLALEHVGERFERPFTASAYRF